MALCKLEPIVNLKLLIIFRNIISQVSLKIVKTKVIIDKENIKITR